MYFQIKSFLIFLWRSKNQHGVQSPFVYSVVTKCFYDKKSYPEYLILKEFLNKNKIAKNAVLPLKYSKLLFRLANFFQPATVLEVPNTSHFVKFLVALGNPQAKILFLNDINKEQASLIYFETSGSLQHFFETFEMLLASVSNQTVWVFNSIYASQESEILWQSIKNHPRVRVTIDVFKFGIVFFRTEQQKEHFIIRV